MKTTMQFMIRIYSLGFCWGWSKSWVRFCTIVDKYWMREGHLFAKQLRRWITSMQVSESLLL